MNLRRTIAVLLLAGLAVPAGADLFDTLKKATDTLNPNAAPAASNNADAKFNAGKKIFQSRAGLNDKQVQDIGDTVALEIVARYGGLVKDPTIMRRINLIGRSVARYSRLPNQPWRFGVLNSDTVNAFSAPNGYVFITRGLYKLAATDDALAGVLGHEIAHVADRHAIKILEDGAFWSGVADLAVASSNKVSGVDANVRKFTDTSTSKITETVFQNGYGSQKEFEADHDGHDFAAVTGYAGGGLRSVLFLLQQRSGDPQKIFANHPPLSERIKRLPDEPAPKL